jgi:hypothetical protein
MVTGKCFLTILQKRVAACKNDKMLLVADKGSRSDAKFFGPCLTLLFS